MVCRMVPVKPWDAVICVDGKKHHWEQIYQETIWDTNIKYCWCTKCGSKTEFFRKIGNATAKWRRAKEHDTGQPFIEFPSFLDLDGTQRKRQGKRILGGELEGVDGPDQKVQIIMDKKKGTALLKATPKS